jgi:hypothetical protein
MKKINDVLCWTAFGGGNQQGFYGYISTGERYETAKIGIKANGYRIEWCYDSYRID